MKNKFPVFGHFWVVITRSDLVFRKCLRKNVSNQSCLYNFFYKKNFLDLNFYCLTSNHLQDGS